MVPRPISPYGASKLAIEGYLSAYSGSYGMLPISFRFSNVYGPRSFHKGSVVAAFLRAVLAGKRLAVYGDGEQTRDFIFAGDLCKVIIDSLESETTGVFQLGSGKPTSVNALLAAMSKVVGEDLFARVDYQPARQGEIIRTYCDISLARSRLGFDPRVPLEQGLAATWEWFLSRSAASQPEASVRA
jgi:UDP-glucose 4-epimerase